MESTLGCLAGSEIKHAIDDLATTLSRRLVEGDEEVASALRELISAVVIHPVGKEEPKIEVTGRLAQLTRAPDLFPQQTLWPTVVAGARFGFTHRPAPFRLLGRSGDTAVRHP